MVQKLITSKDNYKQLDEWISVNSVNKLFLVCGGSIRYIKEFNDKLKTLAYNGIKIVSFRDFQPNPLYESVANGVKKFRNERCDAIIAVGGGSAIDVAKCIKAYINMEGDGSDGSYLNQIIIPNSVPFLVIPTTAGTGSEATRFAVIYFNDVKQSITSDYILPDTVLMEPSVLKTLPLYHKKATMMDALCHAVESFWSVNSTEESRGYSKSAIIKVMESMEGYLKNTEDDNTGMLSAAYIAGKAINITQTTAGHAMSYKLTSLYKIAHGHAVALCDRILFRWMINNIDKCVDSRGENYLKNIFQEIAGAMGCDNCEKAVQKLQDVFDGLELMIPKASPEDYAILNNSVNSVRLKNHPIEITSETIDRLYHQILR